MKKTLLSTVAALTLIAAPALAEGPSGTTTQELNQQSLEAATSGQTVAGETVTLGDDRVMIAGTDMAARDLVSMTVVDENGMEIGRVVNLQRGAADGFDNVVVWRDDPAMAEGGGLVVVPLDRVQLEEGSSEGIIIPMSDFDAATPYEQRADLIFYDMTPGWDSGPPGRLSGTGDQPAERGTGIEPGGGEPNLDDMGN